MVGVPTGQVHEGVVLPAAVVPSTVDASDWTVHERRTALDYQRAIDRDDRPAALRALQMLRRQLAHSRDVSFKDWVRSL